MKPIEGEVGPIAFEMTADEVETLRFAFELYIRRLDIELAEEPSKGSGFGFLMGEIALAELVESLQAGDRFLTSEADWYLARCALKNLVGFHQFALRPVEGYASASADVGKSPAELFGHATDARFMLEVLPSDLLPEEA